jgi:hypothetical protein
MLIILKPGSWYTEKRQSGNELKDKAAKTPDVERLVDSPCEDQLGSPYGRAE